MPENELKAIFSNNLNHYLSISGESQVEVAKKLGVSTSTFSSWCTGQKMPRMDKIEMLAKYFGIEKSDLIEKQTQSSDSEKKLLLLARHLEKIPEERRKIIIKNFEDTIDMYLDAMGIKKED